MKRQWASWHYGAAVLALCVIAGLIWLGTRTVADTEPENAPLVIESTSGDRHVFQVELALTPEERSQGLMFRQKLAPDRGMLFDFEQPQRITMWMRNTFISLDMLFIDTGGTIIRIAPRTIPKSEAIIRSGGLARYVLEVPANTAERLGIEVGDQVRHPVIR